MGHLHRVAHCVHVGRGRLHTFVDAYCALNARFKPRLNGERAVGQNAEGGYRHVARAGRAVGEGTYYFVPLPRKSLYACAEHDLHSLLFQLGGDEASHVVIERREKLVRALENCDLNGIADEIFGEFDADISAARDYRLARVLIIYISLYGEGIFHSAQGENSAGIRAADAEQRGVSARRDYEFIVAVRKNLARL